MKLRNLARYGLSARAAASGHSPGHAWVHAAVAGPEMHCTHARKRSPAKAMIIPSLSLQRETQLHKNPAHLIPPDVTAVAEGNARLRSPPVTLALHMQAHPVHRRAEQRSKQAMRSRGPHGHWQPVATCRGRPASALSPPRGRISSSLCEVIWQLYMQCPAHQAWMRRKQQHRLQASPQVIVS